MLHFVRNDAKGDEGNAPQLAMALDIPVMLANLLCRRGIDTVEAARAFLNPAAEALCDPFLFEDMLDATDCIFAAVDGGERICVYGDYDVDGVMATAILVRHLCSMEADVVPYIPSRHTEGYGLNREAIEKLAEDGVGLLITTDCGVTALEEVAYAVELGMEVIVTDHHQCLDSLPECAAVINPARPGTAYPYPNLCGAGVALKLVQALGGEPAAMEYLEYAAIATVADIVPLTGENRALVALGLAKINSGEVCAGVRALIDAAGYANRTVDAGTVGFALAPRINAAGRTGLSQRSLELFLTDNEKEARRLAAVLDEENRNRQAIEAGILAEALGMIESGEVDVVDDPVILLAREGWNHGVVGIVASRLVEIYSKPVILFGIENGLCTGSARSIRTVHMFDSLCRFSDLFVRFGGHEMAAGLTIEQSNLAEFFRLFKEYLSEAVPQEAYLKRTCYDAELRPVDATLDLAQSLRRLAPFGMGNPTPAFLLQGAQPTALRTIGADRTHLSFALERSAGPLDCTAFSMGSRIAELGGARCDLLATLEADDYKGVKKAKCIVKSLRVCPPDDVDVHIQANVWKFHDAFYESILYNNSYDEKKQECTDDAFGLLKTLFAQKVQGTLALCFTPEGAAKLLIDLKREGMLDSIDIAFGTLRNDAVHNAVVLAPQLLSLKLEAYKTVVIVDDYLTAGARGELLSRCARVVSARRYAEAFVESLPVGRERLIPVYKAMLQTAMTKTSFLSREDYMAEIQNLVPAGNELVSFALRVFSELGFLTVANEGSFSVTPVQNPPQKELSQSTTYSKTADAAGEYKRATGG